MTGNKKRGRPPKSDTNKSKFQFHLLKKPKYLLNKQSDSQLSTPHTSRASSPQSSDRSRTSARTKFLSRSKSKKNQITKASATKKGYAYQKTDYIYGSDFEDTSENEAAHSYSSDSAESDNDNPESDTDFSLSSYSSLNINKTSQDTSPCSTPEPLWLQSVEVPPLDLPESADDLLVPQEYVLWSASIYEVLRRFYSLVRLSVFRYEDFCAALVCEEQSVLLSEIHIQLLKAVLREEDSQQTHFGPLDQKDSVNISLYLIDNVTWPEVLRSYVESFDVFDAEVLTILTDNEYPYTSIQERLTILQFLSDQFLNSTTVRDDMLREGPIHYDDHCRVCHRLGELLCCETCPAVFHLECVDPPLSNVPTEDWQCGLCKSHKLSGVTDCILPIEKQGGLCRHDNLGYDRHGRKYWFMCRRIFVESLDSDTMWYYTTTKHLEILLEKLDNEDMEAKLYKNITDMMEQIRAQMKITEDLTCKNKGTKKSQIEVMLEKIGNNTVPMDTSKDFSLSEDEFNQTTKSSEEKNLSDEAIEKSIQTRSKTGSLLPKTFVVDDLRRKSHPTSSIKKEDQERNIEQLSQIFKSQFFKLGMEGSFKTYVNQYNTNVIALNKPQRNEERDKKRHLSHKFSLTDASEFKWNGQMNGTALNVLSNLKSSIIAFEQLIAPQFMHPNWAKIKKSWTNAVNAAVNTFDIAQVLEIFQICLKQVIFLNVWHEQLGHTNLLRITSMEREEKKKQEKREKRERDDEEERYRMAYSFVKYPLGLKHQVWKQKGEEYRLHGQLGWLWVASCRKQHTMEAKQVIADSILVPIKIDDNYFFIRLNANEKTHLNKLLSSEVVSDSLKSLLENVELANIPSQVDYLHVSKALTDDARFFYPKVGEDSKLNKILEKRELLKLEEEAIKCESKSIVDVNKKPQKMETMEQVLQTIFKNSSKSHIDAKHKNNTNKEIVKEIQIVKNKYTQLQRLAKQYSCYVQSCKDNQTTPSCEENACYSPLCYERIRTKSELLRLLKLAKVDGVCPKEVIQILANVQKTEVPNTGKQDGGPKSESSLNESLATALDKKNSFKLEEIITSLTTCETPEPTNEVKIEKSEKVDSTIKSESEVESKADDSSSVNPVTRIMEDQASVLMFKSPRATRGRPPKTVKPVPQEQVQALVPTLRINRRFPKVAVPTKPSTKEEDYGTFADGKKKYFATTNTRLKINLKKPDNVVVGTENVGSQYLYPVPPTFLTRRKERSLLVLPKHELQRLARAGYKFIPNGFNIVAKNNSSVWPYPCPRPLFKTCWLYRTLSIKSFSGLALQLRILWHSLRWDDMSMKPVNLDGKHQVTTETEIVSLELLKHRYMGKYMEQTQYQRRKVVIPLELPKTVRSEITSTRLGLRKRKRAESPQKTEPQVTEEWIEEDKLELWEIKLYGEKQERLKMQPHTRAFTGKLNTLQKIDPTVTKNVLKTTPDENRIKSEPGLKSQMNPQKPMGEEDPNRKSVLPIKSVVQRRIVRTSNGNQKAVTQPAPAQPATRTESQKVQVIRGPDGKISVRGLNPGQQLIQTADGKLHVVNTNPKPPSTQTVSRLNPTPKSVTQVIQKNPVQSIQPSSTQQQLPMVQKKIIAPNLTQLLQPSGNTKIMIAPAGQSNQKIILNQAVVQGKQIIIKQPQQAQQKMTVVPAGKLVAANQTVQNNKQIVIGGQRILLNPSSSLITQTVQSNVAKPTIVIANTNNQQHVAEEKPIQTVQIQKPAIDQTVTSSTATTLPNTSRTQIIVQNQTLAQQISSGKVQIANVNGQQVLIRQTGNNQAIIVAHIKQQSEGPAQVVPVQTASQPHQAAPAVQAPATPIIPVQKISQPVNPAPTTVATTIGTDLSPTMEQMLLKGQPAGTVIKCVTAQVIQTAQGPRIVLQGLHGADFTQQQSALVQQQVKQQLLKAQESNGKHGVLGPTKIYLAIQPTPNLAPPPLAPVHTTIQQKETYNRLMLKESSIYRQNISC